MPTPTFPSPAQRQGVQRECGAGHVLAALTGRIDRCLEIMQVGRGLLSVVGTRFVEQRLR